MIVQTLSRTRSTPRTVAVQDRKPQFRRSQSCGAVPSSILANPAKQPAIAKPTPKATRSPQPPNPDLQPPSSDPESSSDRETEDSNEPDIFDPPATEETELPSDSPCHNLLAKLFHAALADFSRSLQGSESSTKKRKGDDESPVQPAKRARPLQPIGEEASSTSPSTGTNQPAYFACPYYIRQPTQHRRCVASRLQSTTDLRRHLCANHSQPIHCPRCGSHFSTHGAWTTHIRNVDCVRTEFPEPEGMSTDQHDQLTRSRPSVKPSPSVDVDADRWYGIWDLIFPAAERPSCPILPEDAEPLRAVRLLEEFWARRGSKVVAAVLTRDEIRNRLGPLGREDLELIPTLVLNRMARRVVEEGF